jgi:hypothetical protein
MLTSVVLHKLHTPSGQKEELSEGSRQWDREGMPGEELRRNVTDKLGDGAHGIGRGAWGIGRARTLPLD